MAFQHEAHQELQGHKEEHKKNIFSGVLLGGLSGLGVRRARARVAVQRDS
jgi:hypothetical protein